MIKLKDPGQRGDVLTLELTIFDLLSLQEACMDAWLYREAQKPPERMEKRIKAHKDNYEELEAAKKAMEKVRYG